MEQLLCGCVVCDSVFSGNFDSENTSHSKVVDLNIKIFGSCAKYLNVELEKISDDLKFDLNKEPLPFCSSCSLLAHKILTLHEQIESLTREINVVVTDFKTSIFKSYYHKNEGTGGNRKISANLQEKISHYRHLVVLDSSKAVPENVSAAGLNVIKSEPSITPLNDDSYHDAFDECDIPSVQSNYETYSDEESEDDAEYWKTPNSEIVSPPVKLSDSILSIMKLHGMDKRKLVIKLHRSNNAEKLTNSTHTRCKNNSTFSGPRRRTLASKQEKKSSALAMIEVKNKRLFYYDIEMIMVDEEMECGGCNRRFPSERSIRRHIEQMHMKMGSCKASAKDKLASEMERTTVRNRLYRIRRKQGHVIQYMLSGSNIVEKNGRTFFGDIEMLGCRIGSDEKIGKTKIQCGKCNKYSNSKRNLMRHILAYHDPVYREKFLSKLPKSANGNRLYMGVELINHHEEQFACGICWKSFNTLHYIQQHILRNHPELNTNATVPVLPVKCEENENDGNEEDNSLAEVDIPPEIGDLYHTDLGLVYKGIFCKKLKGGIKGYRCGFRETPGTPVCNVEFVSDCKLIEHLHAIHLTDESKKVDTLLSQITKLKTPQYHPKHSRQIYKNTVIRTSDGKKFYCEVEIFEMKDGQVKCGKCSRLFETLRSVCRHIEMAHWKLRKKPNPKKYSESRTQAMKRWQQKRKELGLCPKGRTKEEKGPGHDLIYYGVELADTKDGNVACGSCWETFKEQIDAKNHIRSQHCDLREQNDDKNEDEVECDVSKNERAYFTKDGFIHNGVFCEKLDDGRGFKCGYPECSEKIGENEFTTAYLLVGHIRTTHMDENSENIIKVRNTVVAMEDGRYFFVGIQITQIDGSWECGKCKKHSISEEAIKYHIYEYHDSAARQLRFFKKIDDGIEKRNFDGVDITAKEGQLICNACWKSFPTMIVIKRHIRKKHAEERLNVPIEVKSKNSESVKETAVEESKNIFSANPDEAIEENEESSFESEETGVENEDAVPEKKDWLRKYDDIKDKTPKRTKKTDKITKKSNVKSKQVGKGKGKSNPKESYLTAEGFVFNGILCKKVDEKDSYKCGYRRNNGAACTREFPNTYNLVTHIEKQHIYKKRTPRLKKMNETIITEDGRKVFAGVEMIEKDDGQLECGNCQKVFTKKQLSCLMGHILRIHQTDGVYKCNDCGKSFGQKSYYDQHMIIHKEERSYTCEDCGISYKQPSSLIHHKRQVHLKIKRHICKICGKGYYHTRDFITHQRRHTGEKPFQCCVCGKNFVSEYDMKCHEKGHDKTKGNNSKNESSTIVTAQMWNVEEEETPKARVRLPRKSKANKWGGSFECDYCDETFNSTSSVKKHMLEDHSNSDGKCEDKPNLWGNTVEHAEKYVPNGTTPNPLPVDYSSPQKLASSSWVNPVNDFSMPVLENMHSTVQDQHQANPSFAMEQHLLSLGHGAFPPNLMPMFRQNPY